MGAIQSALFPKPKEEFPPTGVPKVDAIVNDVKEVVAILNKAEALIVEFRTRAKAINPPTEPKELLDQGKYLLEAPGKLAKENAHLLEKIPELLKDPKKLLNDPFNIVENLKKWIGDPNDIIKKYENLIVEYKNFGEQSKDLPNVAVAKVEEYRKLVEEELKATYDDLTEVLRILPIFVDLTNKLKTFEDDLKAELLKFPGGFCGAARAAPLIKHNIDSIERYRKKYEAQIEEAEAITKEAMEKKSEVDQYIEVAKGYQAQAEGVIKSFVDYEKDLQRLEGDAKQWMEKTEGLKKMVDEIINNPAKLEAHVDEAKTYVQNNFNKYMKMF